MIYLEIAHKKLIMNSVSPIPNMFPRYKSLIWKDINVKGIIDHKDGMIKLSIFKFNFWMKHPIRK